MAYRGQEGREQGWARLSFPHPRPLAYGKSSRQSPWQLRSSRNGLMSSLVQVNLLTKLPIGKDTITLQKPRDEAMASVANLAEPLDSLPEASRCKTSSHRR